MAHFDIVYKFTVLQNKNKIDYMYFVDPWNGSLVCSAWVFDSQQATPLSDLQLYVLDIWALTALLTFSRFR